MCYLLKDQRTRILLSTNKACSPIFSSCSSPFFLRKKKQKSIIHFDLGFRGFHAKVLCLYIVSPTKS